MTSSPRETLLCHYQYDPLDRLISHALPNTPERRRFYCKSRLATEIQGAMRYAIVQQGEQLLAQQRSEGNGPDTTLLATDQQRSVMQAVKANHPPQLIAYSPYGHRPAENGLLSLLGFNGERPDPVTGHYLLGNGYRGFNPTLMRLNSPDKLSPFGKGGLNAYAYCKGDSINYRDPTGHWMEKVALAKIPRPTIIKGNYYLAGFHGSSSSQIENLLGGVNMKFSGKQGQSYGAGFYASPDIELAEYYAKIAVSREERIKLPELYPLYENKNLFLRNTPAQKTQTTPTVFAVYVKNYAEKMSGKDFIFDPGNRTPWHDSILMFPSDMHKDILLTPLTYFWSPPRPYTANLDIRGWTPPPVSG